MRWWFRIEVVLTALKTENLLVAGCLPRMKVGLVDAARFIECVSGRDVSLSDAPAIFFRDCRAEMLRQHPELASIPDVDSRDFEGWLAAQKGTFGWWMDFRSRS